jgi:hypothetical protein
MFKEGILILFIQWFKKYFFSAHALDDAVFISSQVACRSFAFAVECISFLHHHLHGS